MRRLTAFVDVLRQFFRRDPGAVSTDWIVLSAFVIGLALSVLSMLSVGPNTLWRAVSHALSAATVAPISNGAETPPEAEGEAPAPV